jgi:Domain of unknown function (DUF4440)
MKNTLLTFLFSAISFCALAQAFPPFSEKTFNDMMSRYQKETAQFLKTQTAPDFIFVGTDNAVMTTKELLELAESSIFLTNEFSNLKIRQYGNMAIVTGTWAHSHQLKQDKNIILAFKELVTEVFVTQSAKWMYVSHQSSTIIAPKADEEAVIKKVIEKETQSFIDRDAAAMIACHGNQPYSLLLVTESGNVHYNTNEKTNQPAALQGFIKTLGKPDGSSFKNTGYKIQVNGTSAFAYYDEITTAKDGKIAHFHEVRYLEKIGNDWKIIYVGGVQDEPKK